MNHQENILYNEKSIILDFKFAYFNYIKDYL